MINLQRCYELEMMREIGWKDADGIPMRPTPNGKTLQDGFESYFRAMSPAKAADIEARVNMTGFYNSYKSGAAREDFITEFQRRQS